MKFWKANNYEQFGIVHAGKVHEIDDDNPLLLFCGKGISAESGRVVIPGKPIAQAQVTCKGCIQRKLSRAKSNQARAEWEQRTAELAEQRERQNEEWWARYAEYLQTDEWRERHDLVMRRCRGVCEGCGKAKATQVHHLTYKRVREEMLFDLVGVCDDCHDALHSWETDGRPADI